VLKEKHVKKFRNLGRFTLSYLSIINQFFFKKNKNYFFFVLV